jgi:predicted DCC family thiol-disulfide oxidoreductase YuxK
MNEPVRDPQKAILYFDGECNLCNGFVQFILRHDKKKIFLFASLQSQAAKEIPSDLVGKAHGIPDSVVLYYWGHYYIRSAAALRTVRLLGGMFRLLYAAMILPRFLRDGAYDIVARNRYKWFGKGQCMVPGPGIAERFLK